VSPEGIHPAAEAVGLALDEAALARLNRYVELVFKWQRFANLTGAADEVAFIADHVADCLAVLPYIDDMPLADIGSGAGLPGLVIACARPALQIALVEPRAKRARFLQQCAITLDLPRVEVINARVEAWKPVTPPATLICRALSALETFVDSTHHLLTSHTRLLAMKGQVPGAELAAPWAERFVSVIHPLHVPGRDARCLIELRPRS